MGVPDELGHTLEPQPWMTSPETRAVLRALSTDGATVRFVGGCVRDALVGRTVKDIDIATPDPPGRVMELLAAAGIKAIPTGIDHGTITAVVPPAHFEITTLRVDMETYGRRARVEFSADWEADAARRDFTINAIYCDADGHLFDPTGGRSDLRARAVRFVGDPDIRIKEDFLRILRFFRFMAFYGDLPANAEGLAACRAHASSLPALSGERVAGEVLRLLESSRAASVLRVMAESGILDHVLPELTRIDRLEGLISVDVGDPDPLRRLGAINAADLGGTYALSARLRLSNSERERLANMASRENEVTAGIDARGRRRILYGMGVHTFADLVFLGWAQEPAQSRAWRRYLRAAAQWSPPALPIGGADALAAGVPRGPEVGRLLGEVEKWWIRGDFKADREKCLQHLLRIVRFD